MMTMMAILGWIMPNIYKAMNKKKKTGLNC